MAQKLCSGRGPPEVESALPFLPRVCDNPPEITMRRILGMLAVAAMLVPSLCWGWGRDGHRIIAAVAEDHLDETTKVMVQSLIGNNHLYSIASLGG